MNRSYISLIKLLSVSLCFGTGTPDPLKDPISPLFNTKKPPQKELLEVINISEATKEQTKKEEKKDEKKETPKKAAKEEKKLTDEEQYENAIKDMKKYEGLFTIYKKKRDLWIELPESRLNQLWHAQVSFYQGAGISPDSPTIPINPLQAGYPLDDQVFQWVRNEDQVFLVRPNIFYQWSETDPLAIAASRSFGKAILAGFPIEKTHPTKKLLLLKATSFFQGSIFKLDELVKDVLGPAYSQDKEKFNLVSYKNFPKNTVIRTFVHYTSPAIPFATLYGYVKDSFLEERLQLEDPRSLPLILTFNLFYREPSDYKPRLADKRVGYFITSFTDVTNFNQEDNSRNYIYRFDIRPNKPLVWTIDPSVPEKYRDTVRKAILSWNKAFEAIGMPNAIQVQDAPNDSDYDHADGRYNVVRWVISPSSAFGIAQNRVDPLTGQILNASICIDANYARFLEVIHKKFIMPATKDTSTLLKKFMTPGKAFQWIASQTGYKLKGFEAALARRRGSSAICCTYGHGLHESASFCWHTLFAALPKGQKPKVTQQEFVAQYLTRVLAHELGHCLGLRHNFIASRYLTTKQLADDALIEKYNASASVMEYEPYNIQAALHNGRYFSSPHIGPYDIWAIKYGYVPIKAETPDSEKPELSKIASENNKMGLAYQSDEDLTSPNPYVITYDHAKDPINYARKMAEAARIVRKFASASLPLQGKSYADLTRVILYSMTQTFKQGTMVMKFMGGVDTNRNHKGDPGQKPTMKPIEPALQRQAMQLIVQECLSAASLSLPKHVLENFSMDTEWLKPNTWDAPLRQLINNNQTKLAFALMSYDLTNRILQNQYRTEYEKNYYTLAEHYDHLMGAVFEEVGKADKIFSTRRDLQQKVLSALLLQAGALVPISSEDVKVVANHHLQVLKKKIDHHLAQKKALDPMTKLHLTDMQEKIRKFLERQVIVSPLN